MSQIRVINSTVDQEILENAELFQSRIMFHQRDVCAVMIGAITVTMLSFSIYNCFFSSISNIPGPFSAKISPLWLMRAVWAHRLNHEIQQLHEKYGPVVRLSPNEVSFATVEAQNAIHKPGSPKQELFFSKEGTLESMMGEIIWPAENLLTTTIPENHRRLKRALQPAFTERAIKAQESIQQWHTDKLISRLRSLFEEGRPMDLTPHMSKTTWDIVGDLSFGEPLVQDQFEKFETLKTTFCLIAPLLEALQAFLSIPGLKMLVKHTICLVPRIFRLSTNVLPSGRLRKHIQRFDGQEDFFAAIMGCTEKGISMSEKEIRSNASLLVMVGYDTTATAISATVSLLLRHPSYMSELREELTAHYHSTTDMDAASLSQLPFLNGCIQEALRLFPPANGKGTNRTSPGATIDGVYIPCGVNVSADMFTIQRSPLYWARPEEFRPDRWFNNGPGTEFAEDVHASHSPFLLGPRVCIGRAVALQTMRLMIAKIVFSFHLRPKDKGYSWQTDVKNSYLWTGYKTLVHLTVRE